MGAISDYNEEPAPTDNDVVLGAKAGGGAGKTRIFKAIKIARRALANLTSGFLPYFNGTDLVDSTFKSDGTGLPVDLYLPVGDETTTITTGTSKLTFRMPFAMTVTGVRASVNTVSSSGLPTVDINEGGVSLLSTKLTIDANEKTSQTAATPAVISDPDLADDAEITVDIDVAGTGAKGLKVWILGVRA
jgi:hypothetical protein